MGSILVLRDGGVAEVTAAHSPACPFNGDGVGPSRHARETFGGGVFATHATLSANLCILVSL